MKITKIPSSTADIIAMLIDINNENNDLAYRIEELERIENERNERWKETSKLINNLNIGK